MAEAAWLGARVHAPALMVPAAAAGTAHLLGATGYLFVCPENLGAMSGIMKDFFDRTYYEALGLIEGRPFATAIAAGTAGDGADRQIERIVTGWRLRRAAESLIVRMGADTPSAIAAPKHPDSGVLQTCHELGQALGAGLTLGIF